MGVYIHFNGIRNHFPAGKHTAHSGMALRKTVADGDCINLKRHASCLRYPRFNLLCQLIQMDVARMHLIMCVDNSNEWFS